MKNIYTELYKSKKKRIKKSIMKVILLQKIEKKIEWNIFMRVKIFLKQNIENTFWIFNNKQWSIKKKEKVFFRDWTIFIIINLPTSKLEEIKGWNF